MYSWLQLKTARYSIETVAVHTFALHRVPCSTVFVWFRVPKVPLQQMIYNGFLEIHDKQLLKMQ